MEKITDLFISPFIIQFFRNYQEIYHHKILKILIKTAIKLFNNASIGVIDIKDLKIQSKKFISSSEQVKQLKGYLTYIENQLKLLEWKLKDNQKEAGLEDKIIQVSDGMPNHFRRKSEESPLERYIYPQWWIEMTKFQESSQAINSKNRSQTLSRRDNEKCPDKAIRNVPKLKLPLNLSTISPENSTYIKKPSHNRSSTAVHIDDNTLNGLYSDKKEKADSLFSSYYPSVEMKNFLSKSI